MKSRVLLAFGVVFATVFSAQAQQATVEFSADTVESGQQGESRNGRLYVGANQVRTEMDLDGQTMIQIIDLKGQEALMINPQQRSYMRRKAGQGEMTSSGPQDDASPCAGMQNITCKQLGKEVVNGRPTQKWEFIASVQGQSSAMLFWLDEQRRIPIRQMMPDGSSMEMQMVGKETVNGRSTEKWELTAKGPDGNTMVSYQWYDPKLNMNIREEGAGGYTRDIMNIKVGPQPKELFSVPDGYNEINLPQGDGQDQYR
jgi:hypothetical protein